MPSTITEISSLIDPTFPVPGQDNDTQGFRNNFANIKNSLSRAAEEISDLEIIQIALANQIGNFTAPTSFNGSVVTATSIVSQTITNSGDITSNRFIGDGSLLSNLNVANVRQIGTLTNLAVTDNVTIGGFPVTTIINTAPATSKGISGDKKGMIYATGTTVFICYNDWVNTTTNIWARITGLTATW